MFIDVNGHRLFALNFGRGQRTLLAHSGWVGNFEDWIATLAPLSRNWRTVVYDHRGTGESPVDPQHISDEALVDDVFGVMDVLGIDRCVLAGFSRGTVTALRAVIQRPERFDGLVLLNGHAQVDLPGETPQPAVPPSRWPGARHVDRLRWFAEWCTPEPDSEPVRRWAVNILSRAAPEVAERLHTMRPVERIEWSTVLPQITIPTLMIHGELDPLCNLEKLRYIADLLPESRLHVLEGTGHLPAMSQPERTAALIDGFFQASPDAAA